MLDASLTLAWSIPEGEDSVRAERFMRALPAGAILWTPVLWWHETANGLLVAERRGRLSQADVARALDVMRRLPLESDFAAGPESFWRWRSLGREHGLSAYDAAYLELAARRELGLATLDKKLAKAARAIGVPTAV